MGGWQDLVGVPGYAAGTAGTATIPSGAFLHLIIVHATSAGSFTIFGGASVPVIAGAAPLLIPFEHTLWQSNSSNSGQIVFTGTDHYFVHWVRQGNV